MYIPIDIRQTKQSYSKGYYLIHPSHQDNSELIDWIKTSQFNTFETDQYQLKKYSRQRNQLYTFLLRSLNKEVILKVSENRKHKKWYRKLNLVLASWFKDYSLNAYYGAIGLERIGVSSLKVIAQWTCKNPSTKSYLLYEKVDASHSAYELCNKINSENPQQASLIEQIAKNLAQTVKKIHQHDMRHGDPHAGNFLVTSSIKNIEKLDVDNINQFNYVLIDLDKTVFTRNILPWLKNILDLRDLRRFRVHDIEGTECLEYYLGQPASSTQKLILKFWMKGGFNFYKWLKRRSKRI